MRTIFSICLTAAALLAQDPPAPPSGTVQPVPPLPVPVGIPVGIPVGPGAGTSAPIPGSEVTVSSIAPSTDRGTHPAPQNTGPSRVTPRIRDISTPSTGVPHHLTGVGVITGLSDTGSTDRSTLRAISNFLKTNNLENEVSDISSGGTALVSLTAELLPFTKEGSPILVRVQVIGDATSLRGGQLLRAELRGVDGLSYAVVQGALDPGGYSFRGANASVQVGLSTSGHISSGGYVTRTVKSSFYSESGAIELRVNNPTPFNAQSIAKGAQLALAKEKVKVSPVDPTLVRITVPADQRTHANALRLLNLVGEARVEVENPVRVVVDQSTGTVIAGAGVLISPCVVQLSDLTVSVIEDEEVVQPGAFSNGDSERIGRTRIDVQNSSTGLKPVRGGATVGDLLQNLNSLGLTTEQLIAVFIALKNGQYLHAELQVR